MYVLKMILLVALIVAGWGLVCVGLISLDCESLLNPAFLLLLAMVYGVVFPISKLVKALDLV